MYALGLSNGCVHWSFKADGGVSAAIVVGDAQDPAAHPSAYFGDLRAMLYSADAVGSSASYSVLQTCELPKGRVIVTVVPTPRWLVTAIVPPFSSMFRLAMVSPSPVPVAFVEKYGSKILFRAS